MAAFSVATGVRLLYDEGVLPPNPAREAIAFATPAEGNKLGGDGLALRRTAVALAMEDESASGTVELSSAAMQFLVQDLASSDSAAPKSHASEPAPQQSGYPYGGWSNVSADSITPAAISSTAASAPISLLA